MPRDKSGIPSAARGEGALRGTTIGPQGFADYPSKYQGYARRKGGKTPKSGPVTHYTGKEWEAELKRVENKQKKGEKKATAAAETRKDNIRKSKARGTYNVRRSGGAAFNPKLLGRTSPTDFIRGGRGPSGIPRKKL